MALDIYPDPGQEDSRVAASLNFDLMRSLRGEPWLLMEQAASAVSQWRVNNPKRPGRMRLGSYQAIAHGADSVLFFQWRASRGGHERFHSAMLPHSGTAARTWNEVAELGRELPRIAASAGSRSRAQIALYFDWDAWWGLAESHGLPRNDFDYPALVTEHYRPLLLAQHAVDLINADSDLSRYRLVIIPNAYLVGDQFTQALDDFVTGGSTVVCSFFSGVVDENNQVRQPAYPGAFRGLSPLASRPGTSRAARPCWSTNGARGGWSTTASAEYLFLLNHCGTEAATVPVAPGGTDLITGRQVTGPITLPPLAVAVLAYPK